jgi:CubicO group peptidase (beta-lactamase class C family)
MLVREVLVRPPSGLVGRFQYSNAGYAIAGHMAERAAGQPWEQLIRARLFDPLQMTSAGFGAPGSVEAIDQPRGHRADGGAVQPGREADNPGLMGPAGNVHATVDDWASFIGFHLRGAAGDTELLKATTFARLHEPQGNQQPGDSAYAMGWGVTSRPWAGGVALTHKGSNTMWFATTWLSPSRGFAVLVVCNQGGEAGAKACDAAAAALIQDHLAQVPGGDAPPAAPGARRDPPG